MSVVRNSHLNCAYSPSGLAQTVERLPAERKVKGSILGAGPISAVARGWAGWGGAGLPQ